MPRPHTNPDARDTDDVFGTSLPDTVSACTWNRPYNYLVVRTDADRITHLDDHEDGRIIRNCPTRHDAIGWIQTFARNFPVKTYVVRPEPNPNYNNDAPR